MRRLNRICHSCTFVAHLYSLYDALLSINVPSDKARAVVDAMEHEMGTTLATKPDLEVLRRDIENRFASVEQRLESLRIDLTREIATSELKMTIKLGSMLFVGFGLTIAALRMWA